MDQSSTPSRYFQTEAAYTDFERWRSLQELYRTEDRRRERQRGTHSAQPVADVGIEVADGRMMVGTEQREQRFPVGQSKMFVHESERVRQRFEG